MGGVVFTEEELTIIEKYKRDFSLKDCLDLGANPLSISRYTLFPNRKETIAVLTSIRLIDEQEDECYYPFFGFTEWDDEEVVSCSLKTGLIQVKHYEKNLRN